MLIVLIHKVRRGTFKRKTQYFFEVRSANGRQLALSGDTYANVADCAAAASSVIGFEVIPAVGRQDFRR